MLVPEFPQKESGQTAKQLVPDLNRCTPALDSPQVKQFVAVVTHVAQLALHKRHWLLVVLLY